MVWFVTECAKVVYDKIRIWFPTIRPIYFWGLYNCSLHNLIKHYTYLFCCHATKVRRSESGLKCWHRHNVSIDQDSDEGHGWHGHYICHYGNSGNEKILRAKWYLSSISWGIWHCHTVHTLLWQSYIFHQEHWPVLLYRIDRLYVWF